MAEILIEKAGLLSTIQDCGRVGYQRFGMPVSGAMDLYSAQLANLLVGNPAGAAVIEATLIGPEIVFYSEGADSTEVFAYADEVASAECSVPAECSVSAVGAVSVCGAGIRPFINGSPIPMYEPIRVVSGDRLTFSSLGYGCRAYIAFAGGLDVPLVMGSRSTYLRAKIGGFMGRALKAGDVVPLGKMNMYGSSFEEFFNIILQKNTELKNLPKSLIPNYLLDSPIRIITGPEWTRLGAESKNTFLSSEYIVTTQSDRMGLRLSGPPLEIKTTGYTKSSNGHDIISAGHDIISAGISLGTIQLPGNGQPIILMADRQTTGGYARIANVASADLTRIAQLKPGAKIRFEEISIEKAQEGLQLKHFGAV